MESATGTRHLFSIRHVAAVLHVKVLPLLPLTAFVRVLLLGLLSSFCFN